MSSPPPSPDAPSSRADDLHDLPVRRLQALVDAWVQENGGYWPPLSMLAAVMEELGELSRVINALEGPKVPKTPQRRQDLHYQLAEELGDILFALTCLFNHYKLDAAEVIRTILAKYTNRDIGRFT